MLSFMLIFFNDPFYPITILQPNFASSFFSVFFVVDFVIALVFSWVFFVDRIHYENGEKKTELSFKKRLLVGFLVYGIVLALYILYAFDNIENMPILPTHDFYREPKFLALEIIVMLLIVGIFLYIFCRYVQACSSSEDKLWRNQLFLFFSVFFLFLTAMLFFIEGFRIYTYEGNRILVLYSLMNFYVFYLQYMYRVPKEELERPFGNQI